MEGWRAVLSALRRGGSGLAGCCSLGCDAGFDKALLMCCGKAFYHRSMLACMKGMNLNEYEPAHTRRKTKARKLTCVHNLRVQHFFWRDLSFCFPIRVCVLHLHMHSLSLFLFLPLPPFSWCFFLPTSPSMPECKVRITKGTPGKHGCGPPLLIVTHSPPPTVTAPLSHSCPC